MADTTSPPSADRVDQLNRLLETIPYVHLLGLRAEILGDEPVLVMPGDARLVGNPALPALHGGAVGALLESAAIIGTMWQANLTKVPKTITITINYLRSGRIEATRARASITKRGRRVATVSVQACQADPEMPIAVGHAHLLLAAP
ncbi:MAG: PaaI family thioesterase [Myxococcales bacterium]|nr:PaaI family thioesterase [Myxococcales bacterium]MDD9971970.1 PaaI family thioesterase [Myxococcales bacterium]